MCSWALLVYVDSVEDDFCLSLWRVMTFPPQNDEAVFRVSLVDRIDPEGKGDFGRVPGAEVERLLDARNQTSDSEDKEDAKQ